MAFLPPRPRRLPPQDSFPKDRKIVQFNTIVDPVVICDDPPRIKIFALCNDGTMWMRDHGYPDWTRLPDLEGMEQ